MALYFSNPSPGTRLLTSPYNSLSLLTMHKLLKIQRILWLAFRVNCAHRMCHVSAGLMLWAATTTISKWIEELINIIVVRDLFFDRSFSIYFCGFYFLHRMRAFRVLKMNGNPRYEKKNREHIQMVPSFKFGIDFQFNSNGMAFGEPGRSRCHSKCNKTNSNCRKKSNLVVV